MQPPPATADLVSPAAGVTARFNLIIAGLIALIARAFLRDPALAPVIIPLRNRLARTARRFAALMALLARGEPPRAHRPGKSGPHRPGPRIPTGEAWLVAALHHEAAAFASQLTHLLAEPGVPELLAAAPAAGRLLRPLCRMLGIFPPALCAVGRASSRAESVAEPPPARPASPPPHIITIPPPPCPHVRWPWFPHLSPKTA